MKTRLVLRCAVLAAALVALVRPAGAALSGNTFHPLFPGDVPSIFFNGGAVYNADSSGASHGVVSGETVLINGPAFIGRSVFGSNNGGNLSCSLFARHIATGALFAGGGSTTKVGNFGFPMSTNVPAGQYVTSFECFLPGANGNGVAFLFGTM